MSSLKTCLISGPGRRGDSRPTRRPHKMHDGLNVRGMWEEVDGLDVDGLKTALGEDREVPGERAGVAGNIDKVGGMEPGKRPQDARIAPRARRVQYDGDRPSGGSRRPVMGDKL